MASLMRRENFAEINIKNKKTVDKYLKSGYNKNNGRLKTEIT
ncbi:MAG: hypothetical protein Q4C73_06465 [Eubacteriales bacterium]|nr:hypothetical protein [Eubacteriales bacterium]